MKNHVLAGIIHLVRSQKNVIFSKDFANVLNEQFLKEKPLQLAEAQKILYFYESFNKHKAYNLIDRMLCEQKYSQNYSFRNFVGIL